MNRIKKLKQLSKSLIFVSIPTFFLLVAPALAAGGESGSSGGHGSFGSVFLLIAIMLLAAKMGGVVEKFGQPSVIGELFAGVFLSLLGFFGLGLIEDMKHSEILRFLAETGAVILLFQIGLESNIKSLAKVGPRSAVIAILGVVGPFVLGTWVFGPMFFEDAPFIAHLFIGATLVPTSVGIPASIFRSLGITKTKAAQTVLGAAVIDDILGLLVLAIVSAMATGSQLTAAQILTIAGEAFLFLAVSIVIGAVFAKKISTVFSKIHTGTGMKLSLAVIFALVYAYGATLFGLAPIIGAFAAGLILDAVHFDMFESPAIVGKLKALASRNKTLENIIHEQQHTHVEDMVSSLGLIFVPLFFAYTGLQIDINSLLNPKLYLIALVFGIAAIVSKLISGIAAEGSLVDKLFVGMSMAPRGEVVLIFAATGKALGAFSDDVFSVLVMTVMICAVATPGAITALSKKAMSQNSSFSGVPALGFIQNKLAKLPVFSKNK